VTLQILLTNDDGIHAAGITELRRALEGLAVVTTIAPDHNTSAVARGITIDRPLHLRAVTFGDGWHGLACDGTPSDCVRVALLGLRNPLPDLVVSGVNLGGNMGADVTYSGTVGAALEAALRGLPALAFSVESREPGWLAEAGPVLRGMVEQVIARGLPRHSMLNVNLPDRPLGEFQGILPARLGGASCHDRVLLCDDVADRTSAAEVMGQAVAAADPWDGVTEHFVPCEHPSAGDWADTDFDVVARGCVAVTPLRYDLLDPGLLAELVSWELDPERMRA
jgi:5'-nucleotidase